MRLLLAITWLACLGPAKGQLPAAPTAPQQQALAEFGYPDGVALARDGSLYVVDTDNTALRKISPAGEVSTVLDTGLVYPTSVALAPDGSLYVADAGRHAVWHLAAGQPPVPLTGRGLTYPSAVTVDGAGSLYVADAGNGSGGTVQKIAPNGRAEVVAANLHKPNGLAVAADGTLYVSESTTSSVAQISNGRHTTLTFDTHPLEQPRGLALGPDGTLYVADTHHHRVLMRSPDGQITTLADGFSYPSAVAVDAEGTVYVSDTGHGTVKKISPTGLVSGVAGPDAHASSEGSVAAQP